MSPTLRHRLSVTSRILAASVGGYGLTNLITVSFFLLLEKAGISRNEALLAPTIASFLIFAGIILAVFHTRSATRAWITLIAAALPLALLLALLATWEAGR